MLKEIGLSIVSACNANCAFCPRNEYKSEVKFMSGALLTRIIVELSDGEFKAKHDIQMITVGENGEPTLHPHFIAILRLLKTIEIPVALYTNFFKLTKDKSEIILDEQLITHIHTNIDGFTKTSYKLMKHLDLVPVRNNIWHFLELRERKGVDIPLNLHIITAQNYTTAVQKWSGGLWPHKIPKDVKFIGTEANMIHGYWKGYLTPNDTIAVDDCLMWAERQHIPPPENFDAYVCHNIGRVQHSAFIAPNGDWYICCFDVGNELVFGNLYNETIDEIYENLERENIIEMLANKRFKEIGPPCNRVDCCQVVNPYA